MKDALQFNISSQPISSGLLSTISVSSNLRDKLDSSNFKLCEISSPKYSFEQVDQSEDNQFYTFKLEKEQKESLNGYFTLSKENWISDDNVKNVSSFSLSESQILLKWIYIDSSGLNHYGINILSSRSTQKQIITLLPFSLEIHCQGRIEIDCNGSTILPVICVVKNKEEKAVKKVLNVRRKLQSLEQVRHKANEHKQNSLLVLID